MRAPYEKVGSFGKEQHDKGHLVRGIVMKMGVILVRDFSKRGHSVRTTYEKEGSFGKSNILKIGSFSKSNI